MTSNGAKELAVALANKIKLQKLNLRENELEDRGVILLSGPIQSLPALRILDLAQNQVCCFNTDSTLNHGRAGHSICSCVKKAWHHTAACHLKVSGPVLGLLLEGRDLHLCLLCQERRMRNCAFLPAIQCKLWPPEPESQPGLKQLHTPLRIF